MRKGLTEDPAVIQNILDKAEVIWLALVDKSGPYSVPVNFAAGEGVIYIHSSKRGRKAAALDAGGKVAFSTAVDVVLKEGKDTCDFGYRFRSVLGSGKSRVLEGDEAIQGLDAICLKYAGKLLPYSEKALAATAVYAIDIDTVTAREKD